MRWCPPEQSVIISYSSLEVEKYISQFWAKQPTAEFYLPESWASAKSNAGTFHAHHLSMVETVSLEDENIITWHTSHKQKWLIYHKPAAFGFPILHYPLQLPSAGRTSNCLTDLQRWQVKRTCGLHRGCTIFPDIQGPTAVCKKDNTSSEAICRRIYVVSDIQSPVTATI